MVPAEDIEQQETKVSRLPRLERIRPIRHDVGLPGKGDDTCAPRPNPVPTAGRPFPTQIQMIERREAELRSEERAQIRTAIIHTSLAVFLAVIAVAAAHMGLKAAVEVAVLKGDPAWFLR